MNNDDIKWLDTAPKDKAYKFYVNNYVVAVKMLNDMTSKPYDTDFTNKCFNVYNFCNDMANYLEKKFNFQRPNQDIIDNALTTKQIPYKADEWKWN